MTTETIVDEEEEPIPTATLAEIYAKQGLTDKAIKIYNEILDKNPGNSDIQERILELQKEAGSELQPETVPDNGVAAEVKDSSPLAVMQRWLFVIRQGRANVQ